MLSISHKKLELDNINGQVESMRRESIIGGHAHHIGRAGEGAEVRAAIFNEIRMSMGEA